MSPNATLNHFKLLVGSQGHVLACLRGAARRQEALELCKTLRGQSVETDAALLGVVLSLCDRADLWQEISG